jgi:hypothetical protein
VYDQVTMSRLFPPSNSPEESFRHLFGLFPRASRNGTGKSKRRKFLSLSVILFFPFTYCRFSPESVGSLPKAFVGKDVNWCFRDKSPFCRSSLTFALPRASSMMIIFLNKSPPHHFRNVDMTQQKRFAFGFWCGGRNGVKVNSILIMWMCNEMVESEK